MATGGFGSFEGFGELGKVGGFGSIPRLSAIPGYQPLVYSIPIRRYLSSDPLLLTVHKRFMISQFKDGFKAKLRSSCSCITLRMSPLGIGPQVSDHGFEGSTIPRPIAMAQGSKYLRQDIG